MKTTMEFHCNHNFGGTNYMINRVHVDEIKLGADLVKAMTIVTRYITRFRV